MERFEDGSTPHDWLSQREAAQVLHEDLGIHPETARRLLVAGLLGVPRSTPRASLYARATVDDFVASHQALLPLPEPDRNLVFVRVGNGRVRLGATEQHQLDRLSDGWRMSPQWRALCRALVEMGRPPVGFLVTLGGYVVCGADIMGAERAGDESPLLTRFDLRPPGDWYDDWRGRLLPTHAGGASLRVWPLGWPAPWERVHVRESRSIWHRP